MENILTFSQANGAFYNTCNGMLRGLRFENERPLHLRQAEQVRRPCKREIIARRGGEIGKSIGTWLLVSSIGADHSHFLVASCPKEWLWTFYIYASQIG